MCIYIYIYISLSLPLSIYLSFYLSIYLYIYIGLGDGRKINGDDIWVRVKIDTIYIYISGVPRVLICDTHTIL